MICFLLFSTCLLVVVSKPAKPILIEGDMVLDPKLRKIRANAIIHEEGEWSSHKRVKRGNTLTNKKPHEHRWRNGFIPYKLSFELSDIARESIKEAFYEVEKYTCIQFSPWKGEDDYVEFVKGVGCYSSVGRQNGRQVVSIGEGCETTKTVVHELLHTVGMFHEMSRYDRGLYVKILWWNIQRGAEKNFAVYDHGVIDSMNFPYDFESAMHYYNNEFTKNGHDTIQSLENPKLRIGNYHGMSKMDVKKVYQFYKCYKKKERPQKNECKDKYNWCKKYENHCSTQWFAESYCQKTCKVCL